jgi:hypothetical protein
MLLAIAERCGGDWKRKAWAAVKSVEELHAAADPELGVRLLSDIRAAFDRRKVDRLPTSTLIADLVADSEGPWLSYGKAGKPIVDQQLARLLREFRRGHGIKSKNIRVRDDVVKGYLRADLEEDFAAYLPPKASEAPKSHIGSATPLQCSEINELQEKTPRYTKSNVAERITSKPLKNKECSGVAERKPVSRVEGACSHCGEPSDATAKTYCYDDDEVRRPLLHARCVDAYAESRWVARVTAQAEDDGLDIPEYLRRKPKEE